MPIGLLHPGEMGASVGAAARVTAEVLWVGAGRSEASRERARRGGLLEVPTLAALTQRCDVVLSVCPPQAALQVARDVATAGFGGIFADCNAVAPETALAIARTMEEAGARFVDGSLIGPPAHRAGTTRLYLAGPAATEIAEIFAGSPLTAVPLAGEPPAASALKMCYAAYTKGSAALLTAIRALARSRGVEEPLLAEWELSQPGLAARAGASALRTAPKAWRFAPEMREIGATFAAAGLPDGFHAAAAEIYERLARFKDDTDPTLEAVLAALLEARTSVD